MIPTHLYHYTSLDTLKIILETKTIRFNRLDRMNDPLEGLNKFSSRIKDNIFASSWTEESKDAIPMWKLYCDLKGVRIKMPIDLFSFEGRMELIKNSGDIPNYIVKSKLKKSYEINRMPIPNVKYVDRPIKSVYGPSRVEYVNSKYSLKKGLTKIKLVQGKEGPFNMQELYINKFGQKKLSFWKFENEFRFRIFYGDLSMMAADEKTIDLLLKYPVLTKNVDVGFKPESIEGIEILLGPKVTRKERSDVEEFVSKISINDYTIKKSRIKINEK